MALRIGDRVRVVNPDRLDHTFGRVVELPAGSRGAWSVYVEHLCDCMTHGVIDGHVRGYTRDEVSPA